MREREVRGELGDVDGSTASAAVAVIVQPAGVGLVDDAIVGIMGEAGSIFQNAADDSVPTCEPRPGITAFSSRTVSCTTLKSLIRLVEGRGVVPDWRTAVSVLRRQDGSRAPPSTSAP